MVNVLREDEVKPSLPIEAVVGNAPDRADEFFRVPRIVEG
jgi:aspartyl-tRNA(Asn)/glutamyl-tRNA(Gln) amidotransferase subunit C